MIMDEERSAFKPFDKDTWWKNVYTNSPMNRLVRWTELKVWLDTAIHIVQTVLLFLIFLYIRREYIRQIWPRV
jgi:hypothetical protein